jgi:hypothetical protein
VNDQPWQELPPQVVLVLRPLLVETADEMIDAVRTIPAYSRPLDGTFGEGVRAGVQEALRHLLAEIEAGGPVTRPDVYGQLGRGEMRAGRTLESLLGAYRLGARVAWRRFAAAGTDAGLPPDTLYLLAEAIFAYIDVLSAESAAGYALEQSAVASETELRRRRLVRALVRAPGDPDAVGRAATAAGWPLPRRLAVAAVVGLDGPPAGALPPDAIAERIEELTCVVLPDPDAPARRAAFARVLVGRGARVGLGPAVAWPEAALSFARARAALELTTEADPVALAEERVGELLLRSDARLARELAARALAPLAGLTDASRARMRETLRVWLAEQGRVGPTAARLGVHAQTVRYRIGRLRELFGAALDEPDPRFWLELALRVREE